MNTSKPRSLALLAVTDTSAPVVSRRSRWPPDRRIGPVLGRRRYRGIEQNIRVHEPVGRPLCVAEGRQEVRGVAVGYQRDRPWYRLGVQGHRQQSDPSTGLHPVGHPRRYLDFRATCTDTPLPTSSAATWSRSVQLGSGSSTTVTADIGQASHWWRAGIPPPCRPPHGSTRDPATGLDGMANPREELLRADHLKAVVHGKVILSSGREADYYVDLRRVTLDAEAAPLVGQVMLDLTDDLDYDAVGGLTLGADPVATAMLHTAAARGRKLDAFVVRKEGKAHGLQRRIEGPDVAGRRVLAVEDTSTTGGSVLTAVEALRERVPRWWPWPSSWSVEQATVTEAGLPYLAAYELADLGLA